MKKITFCMMSLLFAGSVFSQKSSDSGCEVFTCEKFTVTKPLRELAKEYKVSITAENGEKWESKDRMNRVPYIPNPVNTSQEVDAVLQKSMGVKALDVPIVGWNGQSGSGCPPDPTGAAGPSHYVQAVNSEYRIYTKTGGTVTGGGPTSLGTLLFGSVEGDPIVMYDKFADRWVITEFGTSLDKKIYLGVSKTADPTGQYYTYQFTANVFPDYLKFSIWTDGYYMTHNGSKTLYIFERTQMIAGNAASRMISKTYTATSSSGFFCPLTGYADGQLPPAGTPCPIFSYEDNGWGASYVDRINISEVTTTWGTTPAATVALTAQLPTAAFDASYNSNWDDVSQPGTTQKLDGIGGVFTYRAQYRVWTGYHSVVLCNGVLVSATTGQRAIRWYELRKSTSSNTWSIYQQGTYAPDVLNRWVGSIAMDDNGSIGMAYACSGVNGTTNVYPGIRYTGRAANDALNTMTYAEQVAIAGTASQPANGCGNRFGDYSHTALDPSDGTLFWHTGEYLTTAGNPATRIFSFKIPSTVGINETSAHTSELNVFNANDQINVKATELPANNNIQVDLFDINGKLIQGKTIQSVDNALETHFSSKDLAKGTYLVRIGSQNTYFQKVKKVVVE